jgi:hypothetical protein
VYCCAILQASLCCIGEVLSTLYLFQTTRIGKKVLKGSEAPSRPVIQTQEIGPKSSAVSDDAMIKKHQSQPRDRLEYFFHIQILNQDKNQNLVLNLKNSIFSRTLLKKFKEKGATLFSYINLQAQAVLNYTEFTEYSMTDQKRQTKTTCGLVD